MCVRRTNCLPDAETDAGGDSAVESLDAALLVDVPERVENSEFGGSVRGRVLRHGLHLLVWTRGQH